MNTYSRFDSTSENTYSECDSQHSITDIQNSKQDFCFSVVVISCDSRRAMLPGTNQYEQQPSAFEAPPYFVSHSFGDTKV